MLKYLLLFLLLWIVDTNAANATESDPHPASTDYNKRFFNDEGGVWVEGGKKVKISDGDSKPSESDSTKFGTVDIESGSVTHTYWIHYDGEDSLQILGDISSGSADFTISNQPSKDVIYPGDSVSFSVTFNPVILQDTIKATITIPNSFSDGEAFIFDVQGGSTAIIDIMVKGNLQWIGDGDLSPRKEDNTYFGEADVTGETITKTFWILNTGNYESLLGIIGSSHEDFSVTQPSSRTVAVGDSVSFSITFDPQMAGDAYSLITIPIINKPDAAPYTYAVEALGIDNPYIEVIGNELLIVNTDDSPSAVDDTYFGRINYEGATQTHTFWIHNRGTAVLNITDIITSSHADFIVQQAEGLSSSTPISILPLDSISFDITFDPSTMGPATSTIVIMSNDENNSIYYFQVAGNGSGEVDITVKGNQQTITVADMTPAFSDSTNFGKVFQNRDSKTITYWIVNTGKDTLNIIEPISSNHPQFVIRQPEETMILAGDSISFDITFTPEQEEEAAALITIMNDDVDHHPYTYLVRGEGIAYFNGIPVAVADTFSMAMNTLLYANLLYDQGIDTLSHDGGNTVYLESEPQYGSLTITETGDITYLPPDNFWGEVSFGYQLCDSDGDCDLASVYIIIEGSGVTTYNAFSPDNDGVNDGWEIDNIHNYPANSVSIFNRWGNEVWKAKGYDNQNVIWKGESNAGIRLGGEVPDGTYFYIIDLKDESPMQGYVVLSRKR